MIDLSALDHMRAQREALGTEHIGVFLEWLQEQGISLCKFQHMPGTPCPHSGRNRRDLVGAGIMQHADQKCPECRADLYHGWSSVHEWVLEPLPEGHYPISKTTEQLLAEYTGVDLDAVERERRALLDAVRAAQS